MSRFVLLPLALCIAVGSAGQTGFSLMRPKLPPWQLPTYRPVPWGVPLEGGPIHILAVAPEYTRQDIEELRQRVEIEVEWAPVYSNALAAADDQAAPALAARLTEALDENPDVILIGNVDWTALPETWTARVVSEVQQGRGLLLSQVDHVPPVVQECLQPLPNAAGDALTRGIAAPATPEWGRNLDFFYSGLCGEGRIVALHYSGSASFHFLLPVLRDAFLAEEAYWDAYLSLVARAVRWSARREPEVSIAGVESTALLGPREEEIPPDLPPEYVQAMKDSVVQPIVHPFMLRLSGPAPKRYDVRVQIRVPGRDLQLAWRLDRAIEKGGNAYEFAVPVGVGPALLDVWLCDRSRESRVVDWYTEALAIEGWPTITEFRCSKPAIQASDSIEVRVKVPAQLRRMEESSLQGEVVVRAVDNLGRVVSERRETLTGEGGEFLFSMDFLELPGNRLKIEAFVSDHVGSSSVGGSLHNTSYDYTYITVTPFIANPFGIIAEGPLSVEYNLFPLLDALHALGIDEVAGNGDAQTAFLASQQNTRMLPILDVLQRPDGAGRACPNDPAHWQATMGTLDGLADPHLRMGVSAFLVDAASRGHDERVCPTCLPAFLEFLRGGYEGLGELNRSWGTQYADWSQVRFPESPGSAESWAPYVDVQRFRERSLANASILSQAALQAGSPTVRAGAILPRDQGDRRIRDLWFFASQLNAITAGEDAVTVEKLRCYRIPGSFVTAAGDGTGGESYLRWLPWNMVAHGMSAVWLQKVYTDSTRQPADPAMNSQWSAPEEFRELSGTMTALDRGLERLLAEAARDDYGFAIYDSPVSGDINAASPGWYADRHEAETQWLRMIEALGYQADFVPASRVPQGALAEYRVLLMPAVSSMSDAEISAVKAFLENGGTVLADGMPGLYDERGRRRVSAPLADMFGVTYDLTPMYDEAVDVQARLMLGETPVEAALRTSVDRAAHSTTAPDQAVWLLRNDPPTLLLNHPLDNETLPAVARAVGALIQSLGFVPIASLDLKRDRLFDGEAVSWTYGPARLIAVLRGPLGADTEKLRAALHVEGEVYDLLSGDRLRKPQKVDLSLAPGAAAFFGVLPYEVTRVVVQVADQEAFPGRPLRAAVAVKTKDALPGKHYVWIELRDPSGRLLPHYSRGVMCPDGIGQVSLPLALNEAFGFYTLRARDVLTGTEGEATVEVSLPLTEAGSPRSRM